ncbi:uncharacterized protein PAC_03922 [Phialocephala subalpina]|uniref:C2H2-type domain-containing protein n=1 Tax=Phialocephala subalpina TaxID=576137 RepID=A0A1L7WMN7_9HELO|nr:uncharacterized protein PAC_03922 [Phialocephala subalpina]
MSSPPSLTAPTCADAPNSDAHARSSQLRHGSKASPLADTYSSGSQDTSGYKFLHAFLCVCVMIDNVCIFDEMAHNDHDARGTAGRPVSQQLSEEASQACSIQARSNISPSMETFRSASRSRAHTTPHGSFVDRKSHLKSLSLNLGHDDSSEYICDNQRGPHYEQPRYSPGLNQYLFLTETLRSGGTYHREDGTSSSSSFIGQLHTPESNDSEEVLVESALNPAGQDVQAPKDSGTNASDMKSDPDSTFSCDQNCDEDTKRQLQEGEGEHDDRDCDMDDLTTDESEDDNELVAQSEGYEALVIQAVGGDLDLAARLIPQLHAMWYQERSAVLGPWQSGFTQHGPGAGNGHVGSAAMHIFSAGNSGSNKSGNGDSNEQQDNQDHGQDEQQQDGNDDDRSGGPKKRARSISNEQQHFACHFHKKDPEKYNAFHSSEQGGKAPYRTCAGPGFTSIRRLRDHFERAHLGVQCERCSHIFEGSPDQRVADLNTHRREGCGKNLASVNEGVTDLQWNHIKAKTRGKKPGGKSAPIAEVQKWNEIWRVLFPGDQCPSPWFTSTSAADFSLSSVELQTSEYRKCYREATLDAHRTTAGLAQVNPEDVAVKGFKLWHTKVLAERGLSQLPIRNPVILSSYPTVTSHNNETGSQSTVPPELPPLEPTIPLSYPRASGSGPIFSSQQAEQMIPDDENYHARSSSAPEIAPMYPEFQYNIQQTRRHPDFIFPDSTFDFQDVPPDSFTQANFLPTAASFGASNFGQSSEHLAKIHPITAKSSPYDNRQLQNHPLASNATHNHAYISNSMPGMGHHSQMDGPNSKFTQQHANLQKNKQNDRYQPWPNNSDQYGNVQ